MLSIHLPLSCFHIIVIFCLILLDLSNWLRSYPSNAFRRILLLLQRKLLLWRCRADLWRSPPSLFLFWRHHHVLVRRLRPWRAPPLSLFLFRLFPRVVLVRFFQNAAPHLLVVVVDVLPVPPFPAVERQQPAHTDVKISNNGSWLEKVEKAGSDSNADFCANRAHFLLTFAPIESFI